MVLEQMLKYTVTSIKWWKQHKFNNVSDLLLDFPGLPGAGVPAQRHDSSSTQNTLARIFFQVQK